MKKIIKKVLTPLLMLTIIIGGLSSCRNKNSSSDLASSSETNSVNTNQTNEKQYSIYLMAKKSGYSGTYEEWLNSIKGDSIELNIEGGYLKWKYSLNVSKADDPLPEEDPPLVITKVLVVPSV